MTIEAYLVNYPDDVTLAQQFLVTINPCEITSLTASTIPDKEYQIFSPAVYSTIAVEPFIKVPNCDQDITYVFNLVNSNTGALESLPSFITQTPAGSDTLLLLTDDESFVGTYTINVSGSVDL